MRKFPGPPLLLYVVHTFIFPDWRFSIFTYIVFSDSLVKCYSVFIEALETVIAFILPLLSHSTKLFYSSFDYKAIAYIL